MASHMERSRIERLPEGEVWERGFKTARMNKWRRRKITERVNKNKRRARLDMVDGAQRAEREAASAKLGAILDRISARKKNASNLTLVLASMICLGSCGWTTRAYYKETTRVIIIETEGSNGEEEKGISELLLQSVLVPASMRLRTLQQTHPAEEEQEAERIDAEESKKETRVGRAYKSEDARS